MFNTHCNSIKIEKSTPQRNSIIETVFFFCVLKINRMLSSIGVKENGLYSHSSWCEQALNNFSTVSNETMKVGRRFHFHCANSF